MHYLGAIEQAVKELTINYDWVKVQAGDGKSYSYADDLEPLRKAWSKPAVYRWVLSGQGHASQFLVGQTGNLYKRMQSYVGSTLGRHVTIRKLFDAVRGSGGTVGLEVIKFDTFSINGVVFDKERLHSTFARLVLENLCCAVLYQQGLQLLNVTPEKRTIRKTAQELTVPLGILEEVIRRVTSRKAKDIVH